MLATLPDDARCLKCGYLLKSLHENRCPECGNPFDPTDPFSFRLPTISDRTYRWARSPSRLLLPLVAVLTWSYVGFMPAEPDMEVLVLALNTAFLLALMLDAIARRTARSELRQSASESAEHLQFKQSDRAARMPVVWLLLIAIETSLTLGFNTPLFVRFQLSRPALEREIASIRAQLPRGRPGFFGLNKRVGFFFVKSIRVDPGNTITFCTDGRALIYTESTPFSDAYWLGPDWRQKGPRW